MNSFRLGNTEIKEGCKPFIIAEIGQNHDGSLGIAHAYIDAVAKAGTDAIKFQTHIASAESSHEDQFRINFSYEDKTRYDYWTRMEFSKDQWKGLYQHALDKNLVFLSSPFSMEAASMLDYIGCPAWKIGSGEVQNTLLFDFIYKTGKPVLLSSGMSSYNEIDNAVQKIKSHKNPFAIFQCTSKYPTPLENTGLNVIESLKNRYNVPVGFSDHSGMIYPGLFAMAKGANLIEVHVTFHKSMFGPDIQSSLTLDELQVLAEGAKALKVMNANPVDKDELAVELMDMKHLFEKSLAAVADLEKGTVLTRKMLKALKPGTGIPIKDIDRVIQSRLKKDISKDSILTWDHLEKSNNIK
jgi:N,N'-diacetyllegionaminate synthase